MCVLLLGSMFDLIWKTHFVYIILLRYKASKICSCSFVISCAVVVFTTGIFRNLDLEIKLVLRCLTMELESLRSIFRRLERVVVVRQTYVLFSYCFEALHIRQEILQSTELTLKIMAMFWNAFSLFFDIFFLDNILFPLRAFCFKFIQCHRHLSFIQLCFYVIL